MTHQNKDILDKLFRQLPEEKLSPSFRLKMMEKINKESVRIRKRNERLGLFAVIFASLCMISLSIWSFSFMEIGKFKISMSQWTSFPFYLYIGILAGVLLFFDHKLRELYKKKHSEETSENRV